LKISSFLKVLKEKNHQNSDGTPKTIISTFVNKPWQTAFLSHKYTNDLM